MACAYIRILKFPPPAEKLQSELANAVVLPLYLFLEPVIRTDECLKTPIIISTRATLAAK